MFAVMTEPIETPCIKVCAIDPATRVCAGCFRTLAEIGGWLGMTPAERRAVMADLPRRRLAAGQEMES
jgi:predicted Fe-S protein YdhL (DUF1289 family)